MPVHLLKRSVFPPKSGPESYLPHNLSFLRTGMLLDSFLFFIFVNRKLSSTFEKSGVQERFWHSEMVVRLDFFGFIITVSRFQSSGHS